MTEQSKRLRNEVFAITFMGVILILVFLILVFKMIKLEGEKRDSPNYIGTIYEKRSFEGHSYLFHDGGNCIDLIHDPNCPCGEAK